MSSKITNKRFVEGTPIAVLDTKTNKTIEFLSISEAARYFDTYPKTIWRIVYNDKLYLNRYKINIINNKVNGEINNKVSYSTTFIIYFKYGYKWILHNSSLISYILISIMFIAILLMLITYIVLVVKEIYSDYISTIHSTINNKFNPVLHYNLNQKNTLISNYLLNNTKAKTSRFIAVNREWFINAKLSIYQPIINEVNLDFSSAEGVSIINSATLVNSSPIIERIDLNSVFNKMVINTGLVAETMNNNSLSVNSNRNSLTLNTSLDLFQSQSRGKELLNYQSNILYLLINNLSPSTY